MVKHLINTKNLSKENIIKIIDDAINYLNNKNIQNSLHGKLIATMFFENSTRTLSSFEIAINRLGGTAIKLDTSRSSISKGESVLDTAINIDSMSIDGLIIRHKDSGIIEHLTKHIKTPIINGGDGINAHPTQALLDAMSIILHFKSRNQTIDGKKIAIVGDIINSRVASSNIDLFTKIGMEVILVAPPHFQPITNKLKQATFIEEVIDDIDVIISLRTQIERHDKQIYASLKDYAFKYCITKKLIKNKDIIILHPGPVNRNIDIDDEVLNDERCKVSSQVLNGVYIRMSVLKNIIG